CPHAGGVGLCELVQHLSMFDYVALSGTTEDRVVEFVDHLHQHFLDPVVIDRGHYRAPTTPGFSATMKQASIDTYTFPHGTFWVADAADDTEGPA
ncbi:enolase C-terminal domain-like protein, partial [Streptomyces sp. NPDC018711]|uniref:enolase C-terminal domain-like protein n=1 Tax=Streptomyces sp. NPDC018711 TaxID=3365052 RepID=UPI00379B6C78